MKKGDILSNAEYLQVQKFGKIDNTDVTLVKNLETGEEFSISNDLLANYHHSTNHKTVEKISRTELVEKLENVGDKVFSAEYTKKPDPLEIVAKLEAMSAKDKASKTKVEKALLGESRTIIGRLISTEAKLGRSQVLDLSIPKDMKSSYDFRQRLIDHRTIESLTVGNVRYEVK